MCVICRDQSFDFLWASAVEAAIAPIGGMSRLNLRARRDAAISRCSSS
jgi:hypothetical protein